MLVTSVVLGIPFFKTVLRLIVNNRVSADDADSAPAVPGN